jgi:methylmalonyl-CoA mutase C-terminal domain/subunit
VAETTTGSSRQDRPIRVLLGKAGLDGHDRGIKVIARALRDAGMEVIYPGLRQTLEGLIQTALQEDVDVIGLSVLSGTHFELARRLVQRLRVLGVDDCLVIVGGAIPPNDVAGLQAIGVHGVFPTGSTFEEIVHFIRAHVQARGTQHRGPFSKE